MTLLEHLEELRNRIVKSLIAVMLGFGACWGFREQILQIFMQPIQPYLGEDGSGSLVVFDVTTALFLYMKLAGLAGVFLVSPFLILQFWGFVAPGLYSKEKRYAFPVVFFGTLFFVAGGLFAYFVAFRFAIDFLIGMAGQFEHVLEAEKYLRFMMTIVLGMGVMFELPVMIFLLAQIGVVTPRFLMRHFRWAVLIIFVVAAILTPTPDPLNLCVFAVPTVFLYLLGVGAAALAQRGKKKK